ncbi:MAG: hypothetical protein ONB23_04010 [candidate division KSB1 bacterium]|nr:hypothetical protein [candidate division KSB1 bacterium]
MTQARVRRRGYRFGGQAALLVCLLFLGCERGLSPTAPEKGLPTAHFPVQPLGGDFTGLWVPAREKPFRVGFVDSSQIVALVDSLVLETKLAGVFLFDPYGHYRIDAVLSITPKVYIGFFRQPLVLPPVPDTLKGEGTYLNFESNSMLVLKGLVTRSFRLDTLGYTVRFRPDGTRVLELVSLPNTFPYPGFEWIEFYFVFRLEESRSPVFALRSLGLTEAR